MFSFGSSERIGELTDASYVGSLYGSHGSVRADLVELGAVPHNETCPNDQRTIASPIAAETNRLVGYVPRDEIGPGPEHDAEVSRWRELLAAA